MIRLVQVLFFIAASNIFGNCFSQSDFIITGDTVDVLYTDIQDIHFSTWQTQEPFEYEFDVDMDNEFDFVIKASHEEGTSHDISQITIEPYGNNKVGFRDNPLRVRGVNTGDTINHNIPFINQELYLKLDLFITQSPPIVIDWGNWEYIPICLETENDDSCMYGWVKVSDVTFRTITIESFAVDMQINSLSNLMSDEEEIIVYPNPFSEFVTFSIPDNHDQITFELFDMQGRMVMSEEIRSNEKVNMETLNQGVYFYNLIIDGEKVNDKLIKQ